ncbi:Mob1/phocein [Pseudocohnilembus persalinus]|uniref:Mob1/phocein n=1 Tax=Pseudocohnilembus persalinus TaxID=266149 RepID=A0A0V0R1V6_PSEPJ|nr:Mob1/phocein [Pseudocohnilembus persalinus]|eukprot:KRX08298.1 Mob1/phocein [Pseudocohnilembus persalinus]
MTYGLGSDPSDIQKIIEPPENTDINVWQYEHLRQFILELNLLVTQLKGECTSQSCPKMKASDDWLYVCAAHQQAQECSAIDYMIHNLDQSTSILQNVKNYSSRVSIPQAAVQNLTPIVRRLYRLFSHTYFNHKQIFEEFENEMYLCSRFTEYATKFKMMPSNLLTIPSQVLKISEPYGEQQQQQDQ